MCLIFWVGDLRKSQIIFTDASVRQQLFHTWVTKTFKSIPFNQEDLEVCLDWHNSDTEFWNEFQETDSEIVPVIDAVVEATGLNTQPKSSYLNTEILWVLTLSTLCKNSMSIWMAIMKLTFLSWKRLMLWSYHAAHHMSITVNNEKHEAISLKVYFS